MPKTEVLHIRLTKEEKARVGTTAQNTHLDTSTWARMVILKAVEQAECEREKSAGGCG